MEKDITEQFFKVFGIEPFIYCSKPRLDCPARKVGTCTKECEHYSGLLYPEITAEKLLELICILNKFVVLNFSAIVLEKLKDEILEENIKWMTTPFWNNLKGEQNRKELKHQVRSLFGEGE